METAPNPDSSERPDLSAILRRLAELEIVSVMIEGGSRVNAAALAANAVDKVFFYYAPKVFGDNSVPFAAVNGLTGSGLIGSRSTGSGSASFEPPTHLKRIRLHRFGEDIAVEGYLRDPYAD